MNKEEAIKTLQELWRETNDSWYEEAYSMAINALKADIVRCEDCEYQDECEEIVLFDINDDEIMGHRVHWCSYGRSE